MELLVYLVPIAFVLGIYSWRRKRLHDSSLRTRRDAEQAGLSEPPSLHPIVDTLTCIGCGSCIKACPEQPEHHVLGMINGKAQLVGPADCIGHGACRVACPVGAIQLVFGTATRGVDLPRLTPWFETNVPGIFVAGELGGMGLIRNAIEQGRQAVEQIQARRPRGPEKLDLVIIGAGPAGFSASLAALERRMRFVTLEQESLGGCVFQYPRGKIVMTQPARLPIVGDIKLRTTSKEDLLDLWQSIEKKTKLKISYRERVETIERVGDGFVVRSTSGEHRTKSVLLAIGRRGTPRKLGVTGEDLPKVTYRLIEPEQYASQRVLVVGGGDSALEAAASIAEVAKTGSVILSHRGDAFGRAKTRNRERIAAAQKMGRLKVILKSQVQSIEPQSIALQADGTVRKVENDAVIISAGGVLPTDFLRSVGIEIDTKFGTV
ncbi:MAG: NAD(P)-binding domain-containing protein [Gammaproteobacteria bacterium]|nr:NAD(P)-binding domain-containing protein [Gammaproteobacteria bacterium]